MYRTLPLVSILCLLLVGSGTALAQPEFQDAKRQAAERYFAQMPVSDMLTEISRQMSRQAPPIERKQFHDVLLQRVRMEVLETAAKESLMHNLSLRELNALAEFVETPAGRSAMNKLNYYTADIMPIIQDEIYRAVEEYRADLDRQESSIPTYLRRPR